RKAIGLGSRDLARGNLAALLNQRAWGLATCPDPRKRDAVRAVGLAKEAVELSPKNWNYWNTLGAAHYRAGNWKEVVEALEKGIALRAPGDTSGSFFLAMAYWQLGNKEGARKSYELAIEWMDKNQPKNQELLRFRVEAEGLIKKESGIRSPKKKKQPNGLPPIPDT